MERHLKSLDLPACLHLFHSLVTKSYAVSIHISGEIFQPFQRIERPLSHIQDFKFISHISLGPGLYRLFTGSIFKDRQHRGQAFIFIKICLCVSIDPDGHIPASALLIVDEKSPGLSILIFSI